MQMLLRLLVFAKRKFISNNSFVSSEQSSHLATQTAAGDPFPPPAVPEDQSGPSTSGQTSSTRQPTTTGLASAAGMDQPNTGTYSILPNIRHHISLRIFFDVGTT